MTGFYVMIHEEDRQHKKMIDLHTKGRHYATVNYMRMCRYEGSRFRMYDDYIDVCLVHTDPDERDCVYRLTRMYICESPAGYWIAFKHPSLGAVVIGLDPDVPGRHIEEMLRYRYVQYRDIDIMIEQLQAIDAMESGLR